MKIQHQTKLHDPENGIRGNCMMTCYACYLDLDVSQVPPIELLFDAKPQPFWYEMLEYWLANYCYRKSIGLSEDPYLTNGYDDYYFAWGKTNRGNWHHQVIFKEGKLFHDPHPDGTGLTEICGYEILEKI